MGTWKQSLSCLVLVGWLAACSTEPVEKSAVIEADPTQSDQRSTPRLIEQDSGFSSSLRGVAVEDARTGWISGTEGTLLKTTDGGARWEAVSIPGTEALDFRDIEVLEPGTVLVMSVGNGQLSGLYKTSDAGAHWRLVLKNTEEEAFFNGIAFWDARRGVLTSDSYDGKPYLLLTQDGGESWSRIESASLPELREGEYGFAASGTGIVTVGTGDLWVATGGAAARVFFSPDVGQSWQVVATPIGSGTPSSGIFSLAFRGPKEGVAVGGDYLDPSVDRGNAAWTTDGGLTWTLATAEGGMPQKACAVFLGGDQYLAAGRTGLAYSNDGGRSWSQISGTGFYSMDFDPDLGVGWVAGPDGAVARLEVKPSVP